MLHHTERMMPEDVQAGITSAWLKQIESVLAYATSSGNEDLAAYAQLALQAAAGDRAAYETVTQAIQDGVLSDDFYQYVNPSEFWAVNASRIIQARAGTWVERAVQWLKEFVARMSNVFALPNDAAVVRGVNAILHTPGARLGADMLSERTAAKLPSVVAGTAELDEPAFARRVDPAQQAKDSATTAARSAAMGRVAQRLVQSGPVRGLGRATQTVAAKGLAAGTYVAGKAAQGVINTLNNPVTRAVKTFVTPPLRMAGKGMALSAKGVARPMSAVNEATDWALRHATGLGLVAKHVSGPALDAVSRLALEMDAGESVLGRLVETVRSKLVSDYGLSEADKDRKVEMTAAVNQHLRYAKGVVAQLQALSRAESRWVYLWLNTPPTPGLASEEQRLLAQLPGDSVALLQGIKQKLVDMGQQAVDLGLLSQEVYDKNKYAYLHRDYAKYEFAAAAQSAARGKTLGIMADSFKHRGMEARIEPDRVMVDEAGYAAAVAPGQTLVRLDKMDKTGTRVLKRHWLPGGQAVPPEYDSWVRDAAPWQVRRAQGGQLVIWRDFTPAERQQMGELDEAKYAVAVTISQLAHDIEVAKYFAWVADAHALEPAGVPGERIVTAQEFQALAGDIRKGRFVRVPDTVVAKTTGVKRYGALAGKLIPAPIWNDIRQLNNRTKPFGDKFDQLLRLWKMNKTVLSPVTHLNNTLANFFMADMHDVEPSDVIQALEVLSQYGRGEAAAVKTIEGFEDSGALHGTFVNAEMKTELIKPLLDQLRAEVTGQMGDMDAQIGLNQIVSLINDKQWVKAVTALQFSQGASYAKGFVDALAKAYQGEDSVFRLAKYLSDLEGGMSQREAGKNAREAFLDYDITAPWVQNMRATAFPFVAFTYRMIPMMLQIAAHKPWKIAKYAALFELASMLMMAMGGVGDEEWARIKKLLPQSKTGPSPFLVDRMIPVGKDKYGRVVVLDINRWVPAADVFEIRGEDANTLPWWGPLMPAGPLATMLEVFGQKSLFTGRDIVLATDTGTEAAAKRAEFIWKSLGPNMPGLPLTYSTDKIMNAWNAHQDQFHREYDLPTALLSAAGVTLAPYAVDALTRSAALKLERDIREIKQENMVTPSKTATPAQREEVDRSIERGRGKIDERVAKFRETAR